MADQPKVLIADDDVELCDLLLTYLRGELFDVTAVHQGDAIIESVERLSPDLLILDVMLPGLNGLEVLRQLRSFSQIPVLMMTAKGDDVDRIIGLELGADDYLAKPCNPRELVARIRAILRRSVTHLGTDTEKLEVGPLTLDMRTRQASFNENILEVTGVELTLLQLLMKESGSIISRDRLSEAVLNRPLSPYDRSVDVHVSNLRKKIAQHDDSRQWIVAVRGKGYQLVECNS